MKFHGVKYRGVVKEGDSFAFIKYVNPYFIAMKQPRLRTGTENVNRKKPLVFSPYDYRLGDFSRAWIKWKCNTKDYVIMMQIIRPEVYR